MTIMQESFKYDNIVIYHGKSRGSMCNSAADLPYIVRGSEMGVNYLVLALICRGEAMHRDTGRRVPSKTQCCSRCTTCSCSWMDICRLSLIIELQHVTRTRLQHCTECTVAPWVDFVKAESTTYYIFYVALHICSKLSISQHFTTYLLHIWKTATYFMKMSL